MIAPREYQVEAVKSIFAYFQTKPGNPLVAMPTATGKSVVIAMFAQAALYYYPATRIMVLTHVKELIAQNHEKLMALWPFASAGIYSAGLKRKDTRQSITFAGIGSVAKRAKEFGYIDIVMIDEAHMVSPAEETLYQKFLADLRLLNPQLKVIGFTATPWRLGTGHLTTGGIFTDVCFDITGMQAFNRLIAEGYLCPLIPKKTTQQLSTDGLHMRGGEFVQSELQFAVDKLEITAAALLETMEQGFERKHWLVFASGVQHAIHISDMLNDMGIAAIAIHSDMGDEARDKAILDFKAGKYRAAVNNNVLTTGFDFPAIDLIVMLRPTASTVLWVQMLGRGTRMHPDKKDTLVLDFSGNTRRLGPINDPVIPRKKGDKGGGEAPVKICVMCNTFNHTSVTHCVACGHEFHFAVKIKGTAGNEELLKLDLPVVEIFKVDHITYGMYEKLGRPPMMKTTYYCGLRAFSDYVCIQHDGFAQRKARQWWRERTGEPFPESTVHAMHMTDALRPATHLRIVVNKKYPEIIGYDFDGTSFGNAPANDTKPSAQVTAAWTSKAKERPTVHLSDDDIPF